MGQPNTADDTDIIFTPRLWALVAAMGILIGLAAAALMALLRAVQHFLWQYHAGPFFIGVSHTSALHRILTMAGTGVFGGIAVWLIQRSSNWRSVDVNRSIWRGTGALPFLRTALSAAVSMTLVGAGESLGREQSVKQAGALVCSKLADFARLPHRQRRVLTAIGSATGMGAVYNMPLGGALFGLEVLLGKISLRLALPAIAMGAIATLTSWAFLPQHPTYHVPIYPLHASQILWAALAGPVIGVASALYVRVIVFVRAHAARKHLLLLAPVIAFTALGALAIPYPQLLGNGKDVVQLAFSGAVGVDVVFALLILKPLATAGSLATGMPGGLFTPTLTYGALLGAFLGAGWSLVFPGLPAGSYAVIGATALISAAIQGPISGVVMVIELTGTSNALLVPMLLATAGATIVSRLLCPSSIYSLLGAPIQQPAA
jgi:CIC family chloride channel protein